MPGGSAPATLASRSPFFPPTGSFRALSQHCISGILRSLSLPDAAFSATLASTAAASMSAAFVRLRAALPAPPAPAAPAASAPVPAGAGLGGLEARGLAGLGAAGAASAGTG